MEHLLVFLDVYMRRRSLIGAGRGLGSPPPGRIYLIFFQNYISIFLIFKILNNIFYKLMIIKLGLFIYFIK